MVGSKARAFVVCSASRTDGVSVVDLVLSVTETVVLAVVLETPPLPDVKGLNRLLGVGDLDLLAVVELENLALLPEVGETVFLRPPDGLNLLLDPDNSFWNSSNVTLFTGLPPVIVEEALGLSGGASMSSVSSSSSSSSKLSSNCLLSLSLLDFRGRLALLPVGIILRPGLSLFLLPLAVVPLDPVPLLLPVESLSLEDLDFPLTAAVGPGKSSGTMGRPLTLDSLDGGVDAVTGEAVVVVLLIPLLIGALGEKLV